MQAVGLDHANRMILASVISRFDRAAAAAAAAAAACSRLDVGVRFERLMEDLQHAVQALQRPAAPQFLPRSGAGKERGSTAVSKAETGACLPVEVNELQQAPADQETMELSAAAKKAEEAEKEAEEVQRRELMESQLGRIALAVCASIRRFVNCKDIFDYYASEPYAGRVDSGARLHSS